MAAARAFPRVIFTDDGWLMALEPPVTAEDLKQKMVDAYAGTRGALGFSIGDHEMYHCEIESGEQFGASGQSLDGSTYSFVHSATPGAEQHIATNLQAMIESDGGPLHILTDQCRKAGIPFFPRVRMNSHYVIDPAHPGYGSFRRDRPDLLIGRPDERLPEGSLEWAIRTAKNYACDEVRDYMQRIIFECFERFDVDGVELDFMRHPGWFRIEEAHQNCYLMTDLLRKVHDRLQQVGDERGRKLWLIVRVPPTLADSVRTGLDVSAWVDQQLIDIIVVGGGFISYETPIDEFVAATRDRDCLIYGCIEATRHMDRRYLRGLADRWYQDGADGIYLYNFYTMSPKWNAQTDAELSDPSCLRYLDKIHATAAAGPVSPVEGHSGAFRYASPSTQMPVTLQPGYDGIGPLIGVRVSDDIQQAHADGNLKSCMLTIHVAGLATNDQLDVGLNEQPISWNAARIESGGWTKQQVARVFWGQYPTYPEDVEQDGTRIQFDLNPTLVKHGLNTIELHLTTNRSRRDQPLVVENIEITTTYANGA
ncbi:MAG: hypothetical protein CMJ49_02535 [Planctomycetaceae bacterium]|nr:hypothetical protein [Planctomycetaceae bacterium]